MAVGRTLARGLGLFSIGLGAAQLLAPRRLARATGFPDRGAGPLVIRAIGARELLVGGGLLLMRWPVPFQWLRVAGDAVDLAAMGVATRRARTRRDRALGTMGAVAAITAVDLVGGALVTREAPRNGTGPLDAGGRKPVRRSITIARPPEDVYTAWRDLEGLPRFMHHLEEVRTEPGSARSHWKARAPLGASVEWEAELTADEPGRRIAWRAVEGSPVTHEGEVRFEDAPGDRGTQVAVDFRYAPPAGIVGVAVAKLAGEEPEQQVAADLRRLKQLLEVGEVLAAVPVPAAEPITA
jgi:uncharacterized membrane protein